MTPLTGASVLVTGAGGFIGRRVVARLRRGGAAVVAWVRAADEVPAEGLGQVVDLGSGGAVRQALEGARFDAAVHLASAVRSVASFADAVADAAMLAHLLDAYAAGAFGRVVCMGSADQYGAAPAPQGEDAPPAPASHYALSKCVADVLAAFSGRALGRPVTVLRPFTVYGPGQPEHMFVSQLVRACVAGGEFRMSTGTQRRDFVYVDDVCDAVARAVALPRPAEGAFNLGTGVGTTLWEVAQRVREMTGGRATVVRAWEAPPGDPPALVADASRAADVLGWRAATTLEAGLRKVIEHEEARAC
ncbi:MAG TPA: NAD-dependent epimerase/dehydratase family protein [Longimicrobium sp.]|nr:NAD-dependent epimerase/dehydratase family protein [Longimicrobium sp.]